jgi:hypothetical protein
MRDPAGLSIKAWAKEYEESSFFFEQEFEKGRRIIAWSEEPEQIKAALYAIIGNFPDTVEILLKIEVCRDSENRCQWSRFHGETNQSLLIRVIRENELYVFADGMHQLCLKDPNSDRYVAFDEHGIFFVYSPNAADVEIFRSLKFDPHYAEPIYSMPHFQCTPPDSEVLEHKFVKDLKLNESNSDLD